MDRMPLTHAQVFRGFYDASQRLKEAERMTKLGANDFIVGDVVLLQSLFTRQYKKHDSSRWDVNFQLTALSMLCPAPRTVLRDVDNGFRGEM